MTRASSLTFVHNCLVMLVDPEFASDRLLPNTFQGTWIPAVLACSCTALQCIDPGAQSDFYAMVDPTTKRAWWACRLLCVGPR